MTSVRMGIVDAAGAKKVGPAAQSATEAAERQAQALRRRVGL
jgi:hypothetical protein